MSVLERQLINSINELKLQYEKATKLSDINDNNSKRMKALLKSVNESIDQKKRIISRLERENELELRDEEIKEIELLIKVPASDSTGSLSMNTKKRIHSDAISKSYNTSSLYELYKTSPTTISTIDDEPIVYEKPQFIANKIVKSCN